MSEPVVGTGFERSAFFRPGTFLAGFVLGLLLCSLTARLVSHRGYHEVFTRFHPRLSPEAQYYPTIEEMCGIVRMRCRRDQVLVIVGGNSIFNGVGQPADSMWTVELQRILGDRFVVVNLAFRGALCTDGGALVAEALRKEYPRQVYVANTSPFVPPAPNGLEPYRYLFWSARSRGLLERFGPRDEMVRDFVGENYAWGRRFELWGEGWLDRALRFNDLWNWVGYEFLFTIQNPMTPNLPGAVMARKNFADEESDFEATPFEDRFKPQFLEPEMRIVRAFSGHFYFKDHWGRWRLKPLLALDFERSAKAAFPDDLKARTLIMLSRNSPFYLRQLSADELGREDLAYSDGVAAWRRLGYHADDYGRDFDPSDFGDRTHLTSAGGRKLAARVADDVMGISRELGYVPATPVRP